MKRIAFFVTLLGALLARQKPSEAEFIVGSQAYSSSATISSPDGNDVNDTQFTFNFETLLLPPNQTGDYQFTFGSFTNSIDVNDLLSFVFGDPLTYGTFTPTDVLTNNLIPDTSRTIKLSGAFTPNDLTFGPGFETTPGVLTITINEANVGGIASISASATLATAAAPVPEPSTFVLLMTGAASVGLVWSSRRKREELC